MHTYILQLFIITLSCLSFFCEATIRLTEFNNESAIQFEDTFKDGTPYLSLIENNAGAVIERNAVITSLDGNTSIIFEDAQRSGFHRPHWKFHVWLKSKTGFPFMDGNKILYAVVFYDGEGEVKVQLDAEGKLHILGGYDVKDVLYPWKVGTIGRGNPYLQIKNSSQPDYNGIKYFDNDNFVGYTYRKYYDSDDSPIEHSSREHGHHNHSRPFHFP